MLFHQEFNHVCLDQGCIVALWLGVCVCWWMGVCMHADAHPRDGIVRRVQQLRAVIRPYKHVAVTGWNGHDGLSRRVPHVAEVLLRALVRLDGLVDEQRKQ